jgi:hypothetical protein
MRVCPTISSKLNRYSGRNNQNHECQWSGWNMMELRGRTLSPLEEDTRTQGVKENCVGKETKQKRVLERTYDELRCSLDIHRCCDCCAQGPDTAPENQVSAVHGIVLTPWICGGTLGWEKQNTRIEHARMIEAVKDTFDPNLKCREPRVTKANTHSWRSLALLCTWWTPRLLPSMKR